MIRKIHLLLAGIAVWTALSGAAMAQTGYVWAKAIQGPGWYDFGLDATCDDAGQVFLCGDYEGPSDFGGVAYGGLGSSDMYACQLSPSGTFDWVSVNGTMDTERNYSIRIGPDHHIYTCGYGRLPFPRPAERSLHQWDAITMRTRPDGTVHWGRAMLGDVYSESFDVVADAAGNSYTVGQLRTIGWYGTDTLQGHGAIDGFMVKFDSLGNYVWGMTIGGNLDDIANTVDIDPQGNVWVGGSFQAVGYFGATPLASTGSTDAFIAKFDPAGNLLFVNAFTGSGKADIVELRVSGDGDCYFAGNFSGTLGFPSPTLTAVDTLDLYYGKVDGAGNFVWARQAGGLDLNLVADLDLDAEENLYLGGGFFGTLDWQGNSHVSAGFDDLFFAKTDSNGVLDFLEVSADIYSRGVYGVGVDPAQNMIVTGSFSDTLVMGATTLAGPDNFNTEIFVAKYATRMQELAILSVIGTPYCISDQFEVPFAAWGDFGAGNVFSLELSDANGSFASPTVIGSVTGAFGDTIVGTIPPGIVAGTQYRMRIRASVPATYSPDNGFDITLDPNTSIPVQILGDTVLCNGQPVFLSLASGFVQQVWSTGDTGVSITVNQPGVIWVEATDSNGCTNRDEVEVTTCVSGTEPLLSESIRLVPNPASGVVRLHFQGVRPGAYQLAVHDALGRQCQQAGLSVGSPQAVLPLSLGGLAPGIYSVHVYNADAHCQLRLVVR